MIYIKYKICGEVSYVGAFKLEPATPPPPPIFGKNECSPLLFILKILYHVNLQNT